MLQGSLPTNSTTPDRLRSWAKTESEDFPGFWVRTLSKKATVAAAAATVAAAATAATVATADAVPVTAAVAAAVTITAAVAVTAAIRMDASSAALLLFVSEWALP